MVLPSRQFNAAAAFKALESQACKHAPLTPSIAIAIIFDPSFTPREANSLSYLGLSAETANPSLVTRCEKGSRAEVVVTKGAMMEG